MLREDFNYNFSVIDGAVAQLQATSGNCQIVTGSFAGTGSGSFSLSFTKLPKIIFLNQLPSPGACCYVQDGSIMQHTDTNSYLTLRLSITGNTVTFSYLGTGKSWFANLQGYTIWYAALAPVD